jgi:hypothetical protein
MQRWQRSGDPSKQDEIKLSLARLAVRRQGNIGELELGVYSEDLMPFELEDIYTTLNRIGLTRRQEYEVALPDSPTLVAAVKAQEHNRKTRIRPEQLAPHVRAAIARTEENRRLESSPDGMVLFNVQEHIENTIKGLIVPSEPVAPRPVVERVCPHCKNAASPTDSRTLRNLSVYYAKKADNAEEAERLAAEIACATTPDV